MGMCNLTWPGADKMLAEESLSSNVPMCVSMASSTSLEKMYEFSKGNVWLQLYNFQDEEFVMELLERAEKTGRNILKNTTIRIPAHSIPAFKPAKVFVEDVKNNN